MSALPVQKPTLRRPRSRRLVAVGGLVFGVLWLSGCTFDGYVPADPPAKPLAESEANIADLPVGTSVSGDLDCPAGRCRTRYRIIAPAPGQLVVTVVGPGGAGERGEFGPRIARVVLEGIGQQTLDARTRDQGPPPYEVSSTVGRGVHYILIQGLGGPLEYEVKVEFTPTTGVAVVADTELAVPDTTRTSGRSGRTTTRLQMPMRRQPPGDLSDGADYAADPNVDVAALRSYAFAQDPAAMLKGKPGSVQGNVFTLREIQRQIRYALADRGVYDAPANEAEFLIAIGVGAKSTTWYSSSFAMLPRSYDYYYDQWGLPGVGVGQHTYQDGTLLIDFIDPKTGDLLWHGWAVEPIPIAEDSATIIRNAVRKVLGQI